MTTDPIYSLTRFLSEPMAIAESHWQMLFERSRSILVPQLDGETGLPKFNAALPFETGDREPVPERSYQVNEDGEATIYLTGVIGKRLDPWLARWYGMTDLDIFQQQLAECEADEQVESIRIMVDSPGGSVIGLEETMRQIAAMEKPTVAVTDTMMASAAYFISSQCDRIEATRSAMVGSIGVIFGRYDWSGLYAENKIEPVVFRSGDYKTPGFLSGDPITTKQRRDYQERVMATFEAHDELLTEARPQLDAEHKQGQVLRGAEAWGVGMVDDLVNSLN